MIDNYIYAHVCCICVKYFSFFFSVECDQLEGLKDGSYVVSSNGMISEVTYICADGFTLTGSSKAICQENGTWVIAANPYCCMQIYVRRFDI